MTMRWGGSTRKHGRRGHRFRQPAGAGGRASDLAQHDLRLAGRRAVDEHLSRDFLGTGAGRRVGQRGGRAEILFLEGYLYDKPKGKAAFERAARLTRAAGGKAGIALSDPFCVDRHRGDFRRLVKDLDFVIGNQHEWESLYQTDLSAALEQAAADAGTVVCTRSGHDVVIVRGEEEAVVPVNMVVPVDATGAGDQFAAGFIYGLATGTSLEVAGRMGCIAAAEVIGHFGARPEADVKALFRKAGLV